MYRVRRKPSWRLRWPWKRIFPPKLNERYCKGCGLPFVDGPLPEEVTQFSSGNVVAIVYPSGSWNSKKRVVRIGRWTAGSGRFYVSEYIPSDDRDDLIQVVGSVHGYLSELDKSWKPVYSSQKYPSGRKSFKRNPNR